MIHIYFNKAKSLNSTDTLSVLYGLYYTNYKINNTEFELFPDNRVMTNSLLIKFKGQNIDPDITIYQYHHQYLIVHHQVVQQLIFVIT